MKKSTFFLTIVSSFFTMVLFSSCKKDAQPAKTQEQEIEIALDKFASDLTATPPTPANLNASIKAYMLANPSYFYGSTVTLIDPATKLATYSPYWYRRNGGLDSINLAADPTYRINEQPWLRQSLFSGNSMWTFPYFDAGGGDIWMKTRTVPVKVGGTIIAIATTDFQVQ
jgi:hypothetical protein